MSMFRRDAALETVDEDLGGVTGVGDPPQRCDTN
jgi:hypothetical protein